MRAPYDVAFGLLTRVSVDSDIAPDLSVVRRGVDPETGGRYLEELAFEVLNTAALSACRVRARLLSARGVRRVFAVDAEGELAFEWSPQADDGRSLDADGSIDDAVLVAPLSVEALVHAVIVDDAVAKALLAKRNPVLSAAVDADRVEGRKLGEVEGLRAALLKLAAGRGVVLEGRRCGCLPFGQRGRARDRFYSARAAVRVPFHWR